MASCGREKVAPAHSLYLSLGRAVLSRVILESRESLPSSRERESSYCSGATPRSSRYRKAFAPRFRTGGLSERAMQEAFQARMLGIEFTVQAEACSNPDCSMCAPRKRRQKRDKIYLHSSNEDKINT